MISWILFVLSLLATEHNLFCALFGVVLGYSLISSKFKLHITQHICFLACWNMVDMYASLLTDKCLGIQPLAYYLFQTQSVVVFQVMSFLEKASYCASRHSQVCHLCFVIQKKKHCSLFFYSCASTSDIGWAATVSSSLESLHMIHPVIGPFIFTDPH